MGRRVLAGVVAVVVAAAMSSMTAGHVLTRAARRGHERGPGRRVEFRSAATERVVAWWFMPDGSPRGAVVVLHGVRADHTDMQARAAVLRGAGYAVLLPDLQAHGASSGDRITFGAREAEDALAAIAWARAHAPGTKVGAIGVSLGGAALCLAGSRLDADAVVLEAVFPDLRRAVQNRLRMRVGPLAPVVAPALVLQLPFWTGVEPEELRPVDGIAHVAAPVMLLNGTEDRHTSVDEAREMQRAAAHGELVLLPGARHVDLQSFAPDLWRSAVLRFLAAHL